MGTPSSGAAIDLAEFHAGWRALLLALLGIAISINAALLYGFGTLVVPLEQAFGWPRSALQASISFLFAGAVVGLQLAGWLNLRYGIRKVTVASLVLMALGYLATTQIGGSIWSLYVAFALLPVIGAGALLVTWTQLISLWFDRNRGLALAIGLSGTGITAAVIPSLMTWGIDKWSWQAAFVLLALLNLLLAVASMIWFEVPPLTSSGSARASSKEHQTLPGMTFGESLSSPKLWVCNVALALVVSSIVGMVTSIVPMLRDQGLSAADASLVFSCFGFSLIFGRVVVGYLLDRLWPPGVSAVALALPAIGCLIFLSGSVEFLPLALAAALVGFGAGAEFDIAAFLISRYFGLRDYGRIFGLHQGLLTVAAALAPMLFAAFLEHTGSYNGMLLYSLGASSAGPLLLLTLGRAPSSIASPALAARA